MKKTLITSAFALIAMTSSYAADAHKAEDKAVKPAEAAAPKAEEKAAKPAEAAAPKKAEDKAAKPAETAAPKKAEEKAAKPAEAAAHAAPSQPSTPRVDRKVAGSISDDLNKKCGPVSTQATKVAVSEAAAS